MKAELLKKVKNGVFATKVRRFGFEMYKISSNNNGADEGIYCTNKKDLISIIREMRLEYARQIFRKRTERRLRI